MKQMSPITTNQLLDSITHEIAKAIEKFIDTDDCQSLSWERVFNANKIPVNHVTKKRYSGINIFNLWHTTHKLGFISHEWLTYKQAKANGLQIKKNEKGTKILRFGYVDKEKKDEKGTPIISSETGEVETFKQGFAKIFTVFNLCQTEGFQLSTTDRVVHEHEGEEYPEAQFIFDYAGAKVILDNDSAFYRPSNDTIYLPGQHQFEELKHFYAVFFHELTHWSGSKKRLNRNKEYHKLKGRAFEELVAELGAVFLGAETGIYDIQLRNSHTKYLKNWLDVLKSDSKFLYSAASQASKALEYILEQVETNSSLKKTG